MVVPANLPPLLGRLLAGDGVFANVNNSFEVERIFLMRGFELDRCSTTR